MDRDCDWAAVHVLFRLFRNHLYDLPLQVHAIPRQTATIAEAKPRVDADHQKELPLRPLLRCRCVKALHLVERKLPAAHRVVGAKAHPRPGVVGDARLVRKRTEDFAQGADVVIVGRRRVVAAELGEVFRDSRLRHFGEVADLDVVLFHPAGKCHPHHPLGGKSRLGYVAAVWRHLIVVPRLGEREFHRPKPHWGEKAA